MAEAAPAPVVRRRSTLETLALHPRLELGAGGEARVYALDGDPSAVAKVYHAPAIAQARKVALMMATPPSERGFVMVHPTSRELLERVGPAAEARVFRPLATEGKPVRTWVWIQLSLEP